MSWVKEGKERLLFSSLKGKKVEGLQNRGEGGLLEEWREGGEKPLCKKGEECRESWEGGK